VTEIIHHQWHNRREKDFSYSYSEQEKLDVLNRTKQLGTMVHTAIKEKLLEKKIIKYPEKIKNFLNNLEPIFKHIEEAVLIEDLLVSKDKSFCGRPDAVVQLKNKSLCLIDWKTKGFKEDDFYLFDEDLIQLAGYNILLEEAKIKPNTNIVVYINDSGYTKKIIMPEQLDNLKLKFLALKEFSLSQKIIKEAIKNDRQKISS
jgi:hypothetical protein